LDKKESKQSSGECPTNLMEDVAEDVKKKRNFKKLNLKFRKVQAVVNKKKKKAMQLMKINVVPKTRRRRSNKNLAKKNVKKTNINWN